MNTGSSSEDVTDRRERRMESSSTAVHDHPLQDVTNPDTSDFGNATTNKGNWVKFDDETTIRETTKEIANDRNANVAAQFPIAATILAAEPPTTTTIPRPTTPIPNKLSPPPPRQKKPQQQQQQQQQVTNTYPAPASAAINNTVNRNSVAVAPVQRNSNILSDISPAVLNTESTHVNLNASINIPKPNNFPISSQITSTNSTSIPPSSGHQNTMANNKSNVSIPIESTPPMRTIELSTGRIREGFANGDVIVTLLPANTQWPWVTPAIFRPELVPEELMAQGLTLTVEDYVHAMETLVNDYRFTLYNICYKRILVCWILFAFSVLLTLLFSGLKGVALFSLGVGWLFLNAAAIFLCMWIKLRLSRGLEKCLARVNNQLIKHKILLILDDRGRISCHKVNLCFIYFDASPCVGFLNEFLEQAEQNGGDHSIQAGWEKKLDLDVNDIVIQGTNPMRLSRKQAIAQEIFLTYLQRWGKDFLRRRLDWTVQEAGVHEIPRHLQSSICPCQYEEEILRSKLKIQLARKQCCGINCLGCWL